MSKTTTRKTATPTYAEALAEAESVTRKQYADAAERLSELRRHTEQSEADLEAAEEVAAAIEGAHRRSFDADKIPTGADYAAALSEVSLATMRRDGASCEAEQAAKQAKSTSTDVAEAIVPIIERALPTIRVVATMLPLNVLPVPSLSELPLAVVAQTSPTTGGDGLLSAETVEVSLFRFEGVHEKLDGHSIEDAAHDMGQTVQSIHRRDHILGASVVRDTVVVKAHQVHVGLPVLEDVNAALLGQNYAQRLASAARTPGWSVKRSLETNTFRSSHVEVTPGPSKVESETVDRDGTRSAEVSAKVNVRVIETVGLNLDIIIDSVARDLAGITLEHVGQVTSVDHKVAWGNRRETANVALKVTVKSKVAA
jgi:hypothetical protein